MREGTTNRVHTRPATGFTLLELLVVIAVIGILAAIGVPALRGLGGTTDIAAANRQLLDDLSYARFKAISERTTVYMVFLSPEMLRQTWRQDQKKEIAKLANLQYTSYALFANRSLGDQPGPGTARYLTEWRTLPDGTFFPTNKFDLGSVPKRLTQPPMTRTLVFEEIPFPSATDKAILLPVIAFDYQGRLVRKDNLGHMVPHKENPVIPIAKGSIVYPQETRQGLVVTLEPPEVIETPKGNSTNNPAIEIDWLTGRARSIAPDDVDEYRKLLLL